MSSGFTASSVWSSVAGFRYGRRKATAMRGCFSDASEIIKGFRSCESLYYT